MNTLPMPPISVGEILSAASPGSAPTLGMAQQFARALENAPLAPMESDGTTSTVAKALIAQDQANREKNDAIRELALDAAAGGDKALDTPRMMALFDSVAATSFRFSAVVHVAQSTKNGLQTLMRNQ